MMFFMIKLGANIHAEDAAGRTPLFIAVKRGHLHASLILLYELADPFKKNKEGLTSFDVVTDPKIKFVLQRIKLVILIIDKY